MKTRIVVLFAMAALIAGFITASLAAQKQGQVSTSLATTNQSEPLTAAQGQILSGADVGVRITGQQGDKVIGTLVIKVGNQWKDVTLQAAAATQ